MPAQAVANEFETIALAALRRHKQWTKDKVIALASQARVDGWRRDVHMLFSLCLYRAKFRQRH